MVSLTPSFPKEDKATFPDRVEVLRINPDGLDNITIPEENVSIDNTDQTRKSLQVYAYITDNDGYITPEAATRGLGIYGDQLRAETRANPDPTQHANIRALERIASGGRTVLAHVHRSDRVAMHPFRDEQLTEIAKSFGTPVIVYDEATIRRKIKRLTKAMEWVPERFINHLAVKATDCAGIVNIARQEGMGADCASIPELYTSEAAGVFGEDIMFTSNATSVESFMEALRRGAVINFDDKTHIGYFERNIGRLPEFVSLRYNPGRRMTGGNRIIGAPGEQKYGIPHEDILETVRLLRDKGVSRIGLHAMVVSNELDVNNLVGTGDMMFDLVNLLADNSGVRFEFVNLGGGIGVNYRPEHRPADIERLGEGLRDSYEKKIAGTKNHPLEVRMENGRWVTADAAVLLMTARHLERKYNDYVKVDATGNDFYRVEAYGAYHHVNVVGKSGGEKLFHVAGSKCENSDHFAKNRVLPAVEVGDVLALCGAGAHGHMMGSSYNSFFPCGEVIVGMDGNVRMLTRAKTMKDHFQKYDFPGSEFASLAR